MAKARLSMAFQDMSGTFNRQVVFRTHAGLATRSKARYKYPVTPTLRQNMDRFSAANEVWKTFNASDAEAWRQYASTLEKTGRVSAEKYSPTGRSVFTGLATKFLQANPSGEVPRTPPVGEFIADSVVVTASAVASQIVFEASGPNDAGHTTELLLQRLKSIRCQPGKVYKSAGFVSFESGSLSASVSVEPGVYACAYRFVESATGRQTDYWRINGILEVG